MKNLNIFMKINNKILKLNVLNINTNKRFKQCIYNKFLKFYT